MRIIGHLSVESILAYVAELPFISAITFTLPCPCPCTTTLNNRNIISWLKMLVSFIDGILASGILFNTKLCWIIERESSWTLILVTMKQNYWLFLQDHQLQWYILLYFLFIGHKNTGNITKTEITEFNSLSTFHCFYMVSQDLQDIL